eukprot:SAG31_NODE_3081_length_4701_cov_2.801608_4_plen_183_part_00
MRSIVLAKLPTLVFSLYSRLGILAGSKTESDILLKPDLDEMVAKSMGRFKILYILSAAQVHSNSMTCAWRLAYKIHLIEQFWPHFGCRLNGTAYAVTSMQRRSRSIVHLLHKQQKFSCVVSQQCMTIYAGPAMKRTSHQILHLQSWAIVVIWLSNFDGCQHAHAMTVLLITCIKRHDSSHLR